MFTFKKVIQISQSHCGPAVVQMLLSRLGADISQARITSACGAEKTIKIHGTRIDQLAEAVAKLAPETAFYYKEDATLTDIKTIIEEYNYPVGVEWQGIFLIEEEDDDEDAGHYSVIHKIDGTKKEVIMADPAKDYKGNDHVLPTDIFLERWWDTNEITDPKTGKKHLKEDKHLLFIIVPRAETFPEKLGLTKA